MTVQNSTSKNIYNGDGTTTTFPYSFQILDSTDLTIYVDGATATGFTITNVGNSSGGNVVFNTPPNVGTGNVVILRKLPITQLVDLINYGRFDPEVIETAFDRLVMIAIQLQEQSDRTIRFGETVHDGGGIEITSTVAERAGKVLAYDENGDLNVAQELGSWQGDWSTGTIFKVRDLFKDSSDNVYIVKLAHTSTNIAADLAANKLEKIIDATAVANDAAAAAASASTASIKASESAASANTASASQSSASTSATNAAASETNAATSATNAANSALSASTSASTATTKASDANTAKVAAESARDSAENYRDELTALTTSTSTLSAGSSATSSYNSSTGVLALGIPKGDTGATGSQGATGPQGPQGPAGNLSNGGVVSGDLDFGDNVKAKFGASDDLEIYHNGSASYIEEKGTGSLYIKGTQLRMQATDGTTYLEANDGGALTIKHDGSTKLSTTSTGVDVIGTVNADGLVVNSGATDEVARFEGTGSPYISWYDSGTRQAYIGSFGNNFSIVGDTPDTIVSIATGGTNRVTINSTGLGIGTTNPEKRLHIFDTNQSNQSVRFGNPNATPYGEINYNSTGTEHLYIRSKGTTTGYGNIVFETGSALDEVMRIDSSGNLLVGTTDTIAGINGSSEEGVALSSGTYGGVVLVSRSSGSPIIANRQTTDGDIQEFRKDGSIVGSAATYSGSVQFGQGNANLKFSNASDAITPANGNGTNNNNAIDIGSTSAKFRDLYLSGKLSIDAPSGNTANVIKASANNSRATLETNAKTSSGVEVKSVLGSYGDASKVDIGTLSNHATAFLTNNTERMRIDGSSGNVGIANSNPNAQFFNNLVVGNDVVGDKGITIRSNSSNRGVLAFSDTDSATDGRYTGFIAYDHSTNAMSMYTSGGSERLRIDSNGNLLVGTTSWTTGGGGLRILNDGRADYSRNTTSSSTAINFANPNGFVGNITLSGSSTAYNTSSDYRLKEDVQPVANASDRLMQLNPVNFAWKSDGTRVDGFLAHEAQEVVPESVTGTKDAMRTEEYEVTPAVEATYDDEGNELTPAVEAVMGEREVPDYQGIDQSKLVPLLTAALQEALTKIEHLESRLVALETE